MVATAVTLRASSGLLASVLRGAHRHACLSSRTDSMRGQVWNWEIMPVRDGV